MQKKVLTVKEFYEGTEDLFSLERLGDSLDGPLPITVPDIHRPGLALTGFMQNFLNERVQILGETEILYLNTRSPDERKQDVENLFSVPLVCIIVTRQLEAPKVLIDAANRTGVPVLRSSMLTTPLIHELTKYLGAVFAPTEVLHGTFVDVYGVGLLFTGKSGIGKSEIALDLVERGHRLVADDSVEVTRKADDILIGRGQEHLQHFMEIRGIWDSKSDWERQGLDERITDVLGIEIPQVIVPLFPGKNITVIAEVIAMNQMLKVYGINAAERFNRMLINQMESDRKTRHYLRYDTE
jgi:HPr kinase/phosphorylase